MKLGDLMSFAFAAVLTCFLSGCSGEREPKTIASSEPEREPQQAAAPIPTAPWVEYDWKSYQSLTSPTAQIAIQDDGRTTLVLDAQIPRTQFTYSTRLTESEADELRSLISEAQFFTLEEDDEGRFMVIPGFSALTIRSNNRSRTLTFIWLPSLAPVIEFLTKLREQAYLVRQLSEGNTGGAPRPFGGHDLDMSTRVLQPTELIEPLKQFIRQSSEPRQIENGLRALSSIVTPEEWAGFLEESKSVLSDEAAQEFALVAVYRHVMDHIPPTHQQASCPFVLSFLIENYEAISTPPMEERGPQIWAFRSIERNRCRPAIPFLLHLLDSTDVSHNSVEARPLAVMGMPGLVPLTDRLSSEDLNKRRTAIGLIEMAFRSNRLSKRRDPIDDAEYSKMVHEYPTAFRPKLLELSENDASEKVRTAAADAIASIESEIEKWNSVGATSEWQK